MEETVILCGEKVSAIIPNNLPALMTRRQQLLLQKSLAKQILNGNPTTKDQRYSIQLEISSINSEIKAINIEISKFNSFKKPKINTKKRFYDEQRDAEFPVNGDWESKYHWVRAQLIESMDLLCDKGDLSLEEFEEKKKKVKDKIYALTQWEKQKGNYFEAMQIINSYAEQERH